MVTKNHCGFLIGLFQWSGWWDNPHERLGHGMEVISRFCLSVGLCQLRGDYYKLLEFHSVQQIFSSKINPGGQNSNYL